MKKSSFIKGIVISALFFLFPFFLKAQVPTGVYPNKIDTLGHKQGAWKKLDANGTCVYVGQFKDDKPFGIFIYFDTDGKKMTEMNFLNGGNIAYGKMYGVNEKLQASGKYLNQLKDSLWSFYTDEGKLLSEEWYANGKRNGKSTTYYPGTKQVTQIVNFKDDLEEGPWIEYYNDGSKAAEGNYLHGNYDGKQTWYFEDQKINISGTYKNSVKDGVWMYYYKDDKGAYLLKGKETWKSGKCLSGEPIISPAEFQKHAADTTEENQGQDPNDDSPH